MWRCWRSPIQRVTDLPPAAAVPRAATVPRAAIVPRAAVLPVTATVQVEVLLRVAAVPAAVDLLRGTVRTITKTMMKTQEKRDVMIPMDIGERLYIKHIEIILFTFSS